MGRPRLNVERTTVHLSPGTRQRIDKLVRNYGTSEFIRTLVDRELDRLEQGSLGAAQGAVPEDVAVEDAAEILCPSEHKVPTPVELDSSPDTEPPTPPRRRGVVTHGHGGNGGHGTPTYAAWRAMKERCDLPSQQGYKYCGARGIGYDRAWTLFENFLADLGEKPEGKRLVRRDVMKDFDRENCFWGDRHDANHSRTNTRLITFRGRTMSIPAWAEATGIGYDTLRKRLESGMTPEHAFTSPVRPGPPRTRPRPVPDIPVVGSIGERSASSVTAEAAHLVSTRRRREKRSGRGRGVPISNHPAHAAWRSMRNNSRKTGVPFAPAWDDFWTFARDVGTMPHGAVLMRRDQSLPWGPGNCVWATRCEVSRARSGVPRYTVEGQTLTLPEWAVVSGIPYATLYARVRQLGWSIEQAVTRSVAPGPGIARRLKEAAAAA